MRLKAVFASLLVLTFVFVPRLEAEQPDAFEVMSAHYEAIRLALHNDSMAGVAGNATAIMELADRFDPAAAGVAEDAAAQAEALMPELSSRAAEVADAETTDAVRAAFFELSKPLGRYRKLAGIEGTVVAFCSMAKKAWIQPEGEIGNPYLGQGMPTCGEVIPD